jgi:hypothetical protein
MDAPLTALPLRRFLTLVCARLVKTRVDGRLHQVKSHYHWRELLLGPSMVLHACR